MNPFSSAHGKITVSTDGLADEIMRNLQEYTDEITEGIKKAEDVTAKECTENLKQDSPEGATGKYKKGWEMTVTQNTATEKHTVIHNKEYRLTHLLEKGHIVRNRENGPQIGRAQAFPHIAKNEEKANAAFEERVEEVIKNGH